MINGGTWKITHNPISIYGIYQLHPPLPPPLWFLFHWNVWYHKLSLDKTRQQRTLGLLIRFCEYLFSPRYNCNVHFPWRDATLLFIITRIHQDTKKIIEAFLSDTRSQSQSRTSMRVKGPEADIEETVRILYRCQEVLFIYIYKACLDLRIASAARARYHSVSESCKARRKVNTSQLTLIELINLCILSGCQSPPARRYSVQGFFKENITHT